MKLNYSYILEILLIKGKIVDVVRFLLHLINKNNKSAGEKITNILLTEVSF
jgi:hypothetical protein